MIYFLIGLALAIAAAALWFLTRPLARSQHAEARDDYYQTVAVRDRLIAQLNELDLEERDRNMDSGTAVDERTRLEAELAQVLKKLQSLAPQMTAQKHEQARSKKHWRWIVVALALLVPSVAASLYVVNVTVPITRLAQVASMPASGGMPDPRQMVARLEQRLQQNPDDVAGWLRLGRSYVVMGRTDDARIAYAHAYRLLPKDFTAETPDALFFLGLAAYNEGHMQRALGFWNPLLARIPPDSEPARQLRNVIEEAKKKSGKKKAS